MKNHVLVTGGAGFIGSNMTAFQLAKGHEVWAVDNLVTGKLSNIEPYLSNSALRFDQADIHSWPNLLKAVEWADYIFHFAASAGQKSTPPENTDYTINNIEACEGVLKAMKQVNSKARFLLSSTPELYCLSEEAMITSNNALQDTYPDLHCTIARVFNTIGFNQSFSYGVVVPTFIEQAIANEPMTIYGDGLQTRSFSDVRDTITALDLLLRSEKNKGEVVSVGNDKECRIIDLANLIRQKANSHSEIVYMRYEEVYGVPFTDIKRHLPDLYKLKLLTKFEPRWTLEETIEHILSSKMQMGRL